MTLLFAATAITLVGSAKPQPPAPGSVAIWTLIVAAAAVGISSLSIYFVRKSGRESAGATRKLAEASSQNAAAAQRAADASGVSAEAASRSAAAAEATVEVSRTAATLVSRRAEQDALARRYQDAAELLGNQGAAVRLAGLHALARLADDWPEERNSCVSLLCAYLRIHDHLRDEEIQIRNEVIAIIADHLRASGVPRDRSWSAVPLNFRGSTLVGADFRNTLVDGSLRLERAVFQGYSTFDNAHVRDAIQMSDATIRSEAQVSFEQIKATRMIANRVAVESGARLRIAPNGLQEFQGADVRVGGELSIHISDQDPKAGYRFARLEVLAGGRLEILTDTGSETPIARPRRVIIGGLQVEDGGRFLVEQELIERGIVVVLGP